MINLICLPFFIYFDVKRYIKRKTDALWYMIFEILSQNQVSKWKVRAYYPQWMIDDAKNYTIMNGLVIA